jgi:hypothetical protein
MLTRAKRRAMKNKIVFNLEVSDIKIPKVCPVLGIELKQSENSSPIRNSPSLDKISPSGGYVKDNIQVISYKANIMKNDASVEELILFSLWVLENNSLSFDNLSRLIKIKEKYEIHESKANRIHTTNRRIQGEF